MSHLSLINLLIPHRTENPEPEFPSPLGEVTTVLPSRNLYLDISHLLLIF